MAIPSTFQRTEVTAPKAKLSLVQASFPAPGLQEICIRITATAINPVDRKMRDHDAFLETYPAVLGSDAAGVVAAIGTDVKGFSIGERVFFQGIIGNNDASTFQQYCNMPAELVAKTPPSATDEEAAGIMLATMAVVTAFYADQGHGLAPPWTEGGDSVGQRKSIVVIGGASSAGQYAIQLTRLSGYERIITNASPSNHELLKKLGAHVVLDRSTSTPEAFHDAAGDLPIDFVFDCISAPATQKLGIEVLLRSGTPGRHPITVHVVVPHVPDPEAKALGRSQDPPLDIKQILGIGSSPALRPFSVPLVKHLGGEDGWIAQGDFIPNRPHVVAGGLAAIEEALALSKSGVSGKKVVICPHAG